MKVWLARRKFKRPSQLAIEQATGPLTCAFCDVIVGRTHKWTDQALNGTQRSLPVREQEVTAKARNALAMRGQSKAREQEITCA